MKTLTIFTALSLFALSTSAISASFPCAKATTDVEKQICADPLLNKLDEALAVNYKGMLSADFGGSPKALKAEQRKWVASRNQCKTNQCLVSLYRKRLDETCGYGVVSGMHPECTLSSDVK